MNGKISLFRIELRLKDRSGRNASEKSVVDLVRSPGGVALLVELSRDSFNFFHFQEQLFRFGIRASRDRWMLRWNLFSPRSNSFETIYSSKELKYFPLKNFNFFLIVYFYFKYCKLKINKNEKRDHVWSKS